MSTTSPLRAILVSVNYSDLLQVCLPANRHHFADVLVVTTPGDTATQDVARQCDARVHVTGSFTAGGAAFNKWLALEEGLDAFGRHGWLAICDADVVWPHDIRWYGNDDWLEYDYPASEIPSPRPTFQEWLSRSTPAAIELSKRHRGISCGVLMTPLRRMLHDVAELRLGRGGRLPDEPSWRHLPIHRNIGEWAGYSQIFHASDPHLGPAPWHETNWRHAGGADSFFQAKWPADRKVRPLWECLHLGEAGANWYGRATPFIDGRMPEGAADRRHQVASIWTGRRANAAAGRDRFDGEKLPEP